MTSGTVVKDDSHPLQTRSYQYPYGPWINGPIASIGRKLTRTWSGGDQADRPPKLYTIWTPPPYLKVRLIKRGYKGFSRSVFTKEWVYPKAIKKRTFVGQVKRKLYDDHPYSAVITIDSDQPVTIVRSEYGVPAYENQTSMKTLFGEGISTIVDPWNANDDLKLIDKLRDRVAGSTFNAGVFLGEGRMALDMITSNATKLYRAYRAIKTGNVRLAADILVQNTQRSVRKHTNMRQDLLGDLNSSWATVKTGAIQDLKRWSTWDPTTKSYKSNNLLPYQVLANRWLELQYGWLPLLKDVEEGAQFLARLLEFPMEKSYTARRKKKHSYTLTSPSIAELSDRTQAVTHGKLIARLSEIDNFQLSGLNDPLSVGWELTPFSFVADWFIPIGTYLSARAFAGSLQGTFVKTVTHKRYVRIKGFVVNNHPPVSESMATPDWAYFRRIETTRTVSTTLNVPLPEFKRLSEVPSWKRCANAVALLVTTHGSMKSGQSGNGLGTHGYQV